MSEFEVVLGRITLVTGGLEQYKDGVQSIRVWRKYTREFSRTLLEDLGLGSNIDAMLQEPFGPVWNEQEKRDELKRRLHRDYDVFHDTVNEMAEAIQEFNKRLDLEPYGKVKWIEAGMWKRHVKRTSFTLSRVEYQNLLKVLKDGNECL
ncbi:hypothetical protein SUNI508_02810 [Seiridium unicorne]|uniref:Uncharacterized protein n=1 Tax=Seiridium unicorne TaxID=138068 RepID=A0ABR2VHP3_9PEZI